MKKVESLIPGAIESIKKIIGNGNYTVPKEYNGYINSFGISVRQSGLIPALAFYSKKAKAGEENRTKILDVLFELVKILKTDYSKYKNLLVLVLENITHIEVVQKDILTAAIAAKLAIRVFKQEEKAS
ncbi:MAG: type III-B CRISPR module-associated protein Cmr5 [Spirochaetales bacterium]|nr:type III-B CRISPR module-associated protein Cmr5 [Spirochaetales bacterium]